MAFGHVKKQLPEITKKKRRNMLLLRRFRLYDPVGHGLLNLHHFLDTRQLFLDGAFDTHFKGHG